MDAQGGAAELSIEAAGMALGARQELPDQIEQLYHDHYQSLYRYLLLSGCDPADAGEFLQAAFLRLVRFLRDGKSIEKPRHWLLRVLHNIRHDERERASRFLALDAQDLETLLRQKAVRGPNPETDAIAQERLEHLRVAMSRLTTRQYQYMLLRAEGMKLREIAEMYNVAVASVAEACGRALETLGRLRHE
jgi:RNA polymerase sigma-70 factor (ECF subfamily)